MNKPCIQPTLGKTLVFAAGIAALAASASAGAWWGGYDHNAWRCDPQMAYLDEYGFLDYYGPSRTDFRRLNRDQWRAIYYGDRRYDPLEKALRKNCPRYPNRWGGGPYGW